MFLNMTIFDKQVELKAYITTLLDKNKTIGFVPTMGALHAGHLSLMEESLKNNHTTVVSIFVNPTQFNNLEDLKKYPRNLESDLKIIESLDKKILVYAPTIEDIYKENTISQDFNYGGLEMVMEGKHRPGHFNGVGTIVKKLFEIVQPTRAYFGEKDYQQLAIIKKLVLLNKMPVQIVPCPIYREKNGLAMSSRNERLQKNEREKAAFIYKILVQAKELFKHKSALQVTKWVQDSFANETEFELEYFEIANETSLQICQRKNNNTNYRAFIAVFINNIRLIDNISLK